MILTKLYQVEQSTMSATLKRFDDNIDISISPAPKPILTKSSSHMIK